MPVKSIIKMKTKRIYSTCTGSITLDDFDRYHNEVWGNSGLIGFQEIFDLTKADLSLLSYSDLLLLIDQTTLIKNFTPESRIALINTGGQEEKVSFYCSAKQFLKQPSRTILSFQNNSKALNWLESCGCSQPM